MSEPKEPDYRATLQRVDAEPFSDLEVYNVERLSTGNLQPRLAFAPELSDRDGLHPYHPKVGRNGDGNGLVLVNEQNLPPSAVVQDPKKSRFGWMFREWTFRERKIARLAVLIFIVVVVIGGAVGGVLGSRKSHSDSTPNAIQNSPKPSTGSSSATASSSSTNPTGSRNLPKPTPSWLDAVPTTTDAALSVPSGHYELPLKRTNESQDCFGDPAYSLLWTCSNSSTLRFDISSPVEIAWQGPLDPNAMSDLIYGDQLPIDGTAVYQLAPYMDIKSPELGTAMFFNFPFNRRVIIHEDAMPRPASNQQSRSISLPSLLSKRSDPSYGQPVGKTDRPYFCYWESTILQFFAYVNATSPGNSSTLPPSSTNGVTSIPYPGLVKLIEKRKPTDDNVQPYCQHMDHGGKSGALPGEPLINITEVHTATSQNCVCERVSSYADA